MPNQLRFLGLAAPPNSADDTDEALNEIIRSLDALDPQRARFFASFAYVLARVAGADLRVDEREVESMQRVLIEVAGIPTDEARLAAEIARKQMDQLEASHNYLVTREFARMSDDTEKIQLLECLFTIAAADGTISGDESSEVLSIAEEIGLSRKDALAIRSQFRDRLSEFQNRRG